MPHRSFLPLAFCLLVAGCTVDTGSGEGRTETSPTSTSTTSDAVTVSEPSTPRSVGLVEVAETTFELEADCYAPGAGEIIAIGLGRADDIRVEVYVQAFLGQPYLGITVIDGETSTLYEPSVDRPLEITRVGDVVRADDIVLVTDLDLATGEGTEAGEGTVVIECRSYEEDVPPGFAVG